MIDSAEGIARSHHLDMRVLGEPGDDGVDVTGVGVAGRAEDEVAAAIHQDAHANIGGGLGGDAVGELRAERVVLPLEHEHVETLGGAVDGVDERLQRFLAVGVQADVGRLALTAELGIEVLFERVGGMRVRPRRDSGGTIASRIMTRLPNAPRPTAQR